MGDYWLEHHGQIFTNVLYGALAVAVVLEALMPRSPKTGIGGRWLTNAAFAFINNLLLSLIAPLLAISLALSLQGGAWGITPWWGIPGPLSGLIYILLVDLAFYGLHRLMHTPWGWRFHQIHHSDEEMDCTTGLRFHFGEAMAQTVLASLAVVVIAPPPLAVVVHHLLQILINLFSHANLALPDTLERRLRWVIITPAMHGIHHSEEESDGQHNFSVLLSCWDRLFGTYRAEPMAGRDRLSFGLKELKSAPPVRFKLPYLLLLPFFNQSNPSPAESDQQSSPPSPLPRR
ncbi:MAG: sterol desaturase family protein [Candidatus Competibacterales bacterium]